MGFFSDMRGGQFRPGPGVDAPPPATGAARFWFVLKNHFGQLVALNLLTLLFAVPVVTLPAALCGMNAVIANLVWHGNCFLWPDFLAGFKTRFWQKTIAGAPFVLVVAGVVFMAVAEIRGAGFWVALGVGVGFFLAACYFFPRAATSDLPMRTLAATSFALVATSAKQTLALVPALLTAALLAAFYISLLPVTVLVGVSLVVLLAQVAVQPVVAGQPAPADEAASRPHGS